MTRRTTRLIARVALEVDGHLLCVRHATAAGAFWCLPGGKAEAGERLPTTALRELAEETGLVATLDGVIQLLEVTGRPLEIVFAGHLETVPVPPLRLSSADAITAVRWLPRPALPADFRPEGLGDRLRANPLAELPRIPFDR